MTVEKKPFVVAIAIAADGMDVKNIVLNADQVVALDKFLSYGHQGAGQLKNALFNFVFVAREHHGGGKS